MFFMKSSFETTQASPTEGNVILFSWLYLLAASFLSVAYAMYLLLYLYDTVSLISLSIIAFLVLSEFLLYMQVERHDELYVDTTLD